MTTIFPVGTPPPLSPERPAVQPPHGPDAAIAALRRAVRQFEAVFLAEMLRHAGFGQMPGTFNGGAGEAGFAGTLIQEYANRIAEAGGLGIADRISAAARPRPTPGPATPGRSGG